jgi:hypothetical protein
MYIIPLLYQEGFSKMTIQEAVARRAASALERVAEARRAAIAAGQICPFCESLRSHDPMGFRSYLCGTRGAINLAAYCNGGPVRLWSARRTLLCIEREKQLRRD